MVQMQIKDQMEIKRMPGNSCCADCPQKNPEWASVTFGSLHCLKCSGIHRSLGVHISFVRSVAMDSWTQPQLQAMRKGGGNDNLNNFLKQHGGHGGPTTSAASIQQKYDSPVAKLYAAKLKARVQGKPEPKATDYLPATTIPSPSTPSTTSGGWRSLSNKPQTARSHSPSSTMVNFDDFGFGSGAPKTTTTTTMKMPVAAASKKPATSGLNSSDFFASFGA